MVGWFNLLFALIILGVWLLSARFEWQTPPSVATLLQKISRRCSRRQERTELVLRIESGQCNPGDLEKEIYIIRKSYKHSGGAIVLNIKVEDFNNLNREIPKIKSRLEKRFPGMTLNFVGKGKGEWDAFQCFD